MQTTGQVIQGSFSGHTMPVQFRDIRIKELNR